jgi:glutamate-1-semialdehyde 2,1-aminomutase
VGALLIFDEVVTGFRLGLGGAAAHFAVAPDLHVFGKVAGGGFPIGVYGGRRDVMDAAVTPRGLEAHGAATIFQSGTFSGTPASMAAGLALLDAIADGTAHGRANARGGAIRAGWTDIVTRLELDAQVTGMASWLGLSFTDRELRTLRDHAGADDRRAAAFSLGLLADGVYLAPGHAGFVSAAHSEADVDHVLAVSERVLSEIAAAA